MARIVTDPVVTPRTFDLQEADGASRDTYRIGAVCRHP